MHKTPKERLEDSFYNSTESLWKTLSNSNALMKNTEETNNAKPQNI